VTAARAFFVCYVVSLKESVHVNYRELKAASTPEFCTSHRLRDWLSLLYKEAIKRVSIALQAAESAIRTLRNKGRWEKDF
jgi:hypothetical protein